MSNSADNWDIVGHQWAVRLLAGQIAAGRSRHAYLIAGAPGLGKTTLATRLAQAFNCVGLMPPCGECRPCDLIGRRIHPDVLIVEPEGAYIKIEAIRDLQSALALRPFEAHYRIALILDAQQMTAPAADALLKTLEEPPTTARLILTAQVVEAVPPTIASRCQAIPLRPVPAAQIEAALVGRFRLPPDQAALLARLAGGRPGWAIEAASPPAGAQGPAPLQAQRAEMLNDLLAVLRLRRAGRFGWSEEKAAHAEKLPLLLDTWRAWWRDVLLLAEGSQVEPVNVDHLETLAEVAHAVGPQGARRALRAVHETASLLAETNVNTRLALDVMLLRMPYL